MKHEKDCSCLFCATRHRIGFVSTRIAGTDGVSLETFKWAEILEKHNFKCFYFAGELEVPPEKGYLSDKAHFLHPEIRHVYHSCFAKRHRKRSITKQIHQLKEDLKDDLYDFVSKYNINLLIPQNAQSLSAEQRGSAEE